MDERPGDAFPMLTLQTQRVLASEREDIALLVLRTILRAQGQVGSDLDRAAAARELPARQGETSAQTAERHVRGLGRPAGQDAASWLRDLDLLDDWRRIMRREQHLAYEEDR